MEEGGGEGCKSDGNGNDGGRATKMVRVSRKATKTKRTMGMATTVAGDKEGNGDSSRSNGDGNDGNSANDDKVNDDDSDDRDNKDDHDDHDNRQRQQQ